MHDPRTVAALIETVKNQTLERDAACLTMLGERVLVAEIELLRGLIVGVIELCVPMGGVGYDRDYIDKLRAAIPGGGE